MQRIVIKEICDKGFIWNPNNCDCECDKSCHVGEYLDYKTYAILVQYIHCIICHIFHVFKNSQQWSFPSLSKSCPTKLIPFFDKLEKMTHLLSI